MCLCKYYNTLLCALQALFCVILKYLQTPLTGFEPACREVNHAFSR